MGQPIDVKAVMLGTVALFDTDRSITGQDGHNFDGPSERTDPPAELSNRLFNSIPELTNVHVLSNTVSASRSDEWSEDLLADATDIVAGLFVFYDDEVDSFDELRAKHYNATISKVREHNEDLWVMWVRPDEPIEPFGAGQYTTLALGYWEPRADQADEDFDDEQRRKLARRSYSVSSSMIDLETGDLLEPHLPEVEFYIVKVRPGEEEIPALTPRIFLKDVGDKIFMGRKFTGRYTLEGVEPNDNIVFLSTGTGEAPQNAMTAELLRRGHEGRILNLVCVRYRDDLAYLKEQEAVESRYDNYNYEVLTTREPEDEGNKRYIQDLIRNGEVEELLGAPLDPEKTHVFLCGNPAMIGLPKWEENEPTFPEPTGVCELLHERGFTIDHHKTRGTVHYEEYWKERD
jgi:ferredoxin/flavodoxin---NADP+ reductase